MNPIPFSLSQLPLTLEAGIVTNTKPFIPKTRKMSCYVLRYVTQGSMTLIEDDETYEMHAGSILILSANHEHSATHETSPNTCWYYIHFHLQEPEENTIHYKEYLPISTATSLTPENYQYSLILPKYMELPTSNLIQNKFDQLVHLFRSNDPFHMGYQNAVLLEILLDLCRIDSDMHIPSPEVSTVNHLLQYLNDHVADPFRSEEISGKMNLNYNYLCDIFKKQTGTTIQQYHASLKMKEAERYLRTTEYSISEISAKLGYQDPLYFSNVFKKYHDVSPKKYRDLNHSYQKKESI